MIMVKNDYIWSLLYCMIFCVSVCGADKDFFSKVIIWGHPLHSHTHSYIHEGFYRAFKHLEYEVYWVSNLDELNNIDIHNALFITEGQVDSDIPKRQDCYYILHNCVIHDYQELFNNNRCIILQVYTHDCLTHVTEKINDCIYSNSDEKIIFMPWATDLLSYEIDDIQEHLVENKKELKVNWIGTIGRGRFGNEIELNAFKKACSENNIIFNQRVNVPRMKSIDLIKASYMAPALQGSWQCENGYIPCRIFKNISYGQWGITNNPVVYKLFKGKVIYNADSYQLFYDAQKYIKQASIIELYELMDFVKNNHTYINRIEVLLTFMRKSLHIKEENEVV